MARKTESARKSKSAAHPLPKKWTALASILVAVATLGFGNWFAHQPTATREAFGPLEAPLEVLGALTADMTDALGVTGRDVAVEYSGPIAKGPVPFGLPEVVDGKKAPRDIKLLKRQGYWVGYSPSLGHAVWVAYALPTKRLLEEAPERPSGFKRDNEVANSPVHEDYTGSGYDRGHLAPNYAIATRYGRAAQLETFLMTNIAPQKPELNRGPWKELEHTVANELSDIGDTIWVLVLPVGETLPKYLEGKTQRKKVRVPQGFCMVLMSHHKGELRTLGCYMPQDVRPSKDARYCFRSLREIEAMTGLNLLAGLPQKAQDALEVPEANRFWPTMELF